MTEVQSLILYQWLSCKYTYQLSHLFTLIITMKHNYIKNELENTACTLGIFSAYLENLTPPQVKLDCLDV